MLIQRLFFYFRGYLIITVTGNFTERFINVCTAKNILLWDIKKISSKAIRCKISVRGFKKLPKIAYNTATSVKINSKIGFPFVMKRYKHRKLFLSGALIFVLFIIISNQFVWDIEVRGNKLVKASDILLALEEEGLKCGILKSKIDQRYLKNKVMLKLPSLAWLWIDKDGSKVIVDVRERIPVPEIVNPDDYCNIVALKDSVIESLIVRNGIPVVSVGDTVLKDTVLVTGKIPNSLKNEIRYVQSDAEVYGRVWYEKSEKFSRLSEIRNETGNRKRRFKLKIFNKEIPLYFSKTAPYENYDEEVKEHKLSFFGKFLGISLFSYEYREVTVSKEIHTKESVAKDGASTLKKQIDEEALPNSRLVSVSDSFEEIDETTVLVTVKAEYIENIAEKVRGEKIFHITENEESDT